MKEKKETFTLYGHKRDVLGFRTYDVEKTCKVISRTFHETRFRLILDGGETYEAIYRTELTERYGHIAKPVSLERAYIGDELVYPQGERFSAYGGTLTTWDKEDRELINSLVHSQPHGDPDQPGTHGVSYPLRINSIQIMDSEFEKVRYMGSEFTLSEQLKETFRWMVECNAVGLDHAKTKSEIESHLRDKGLIDPQASNFQVSGMFKAKLSKLAEVLRAEKVNYKEYRYFIR